MTKFGIATVVLAVSTFRSTAQTFYPDWSGGSGSCIDSTVTPSGNFLFTTQIGYLEATLESCCTRYYPSTSYNPCITKAGGTLIGTGQYYPLWTSSPQRCAKDCATGAGDLACGGILGPGVGGSPTHATAAACCSAHFGYVKGDSCVASANGGTWGGSGKFYLDSSDNICVQDCTGIAPCGGVVTQNDITLYSTIELCCSNKLPSLNPTFCYEQSNPNSVGTNKWFLEQKLCKKDCVGTGKECGNANAYDTLYATAKECCAKMSWATAGYCESRSDPGTYGVPLGSEYTGLWFVNYADNVCNKDCATGSGDATCAKLGDGSSVTLYTTAALCCDAKLNWIDSATCTQVSTSGAAAAATGTSKWYADYSSAQRCVMDCPAGNPNFTCGGVVGNTAGVSFYSSVTDCCSSKFGWYQPELCRALSEAGKGNNAVTGLWYAKYANDACVQDCPKAAATPQCEGNPSSYSEPMYATSALCCAGKFNWIDGTSCENKSNNGGADPTVGTNKWYADYTGSKCSQDCPGAVGGCGGIVKSTQGLEMYDTVDSCCSGRFNWINGALCKALSTGSKYTYMFYPDQGKGICVQDCAASPSSPCAGTPNDKAIALYTDISTCCTSSVGWASKNKCEQIPDTLSGTSEWYINWSLRKCVKNCAKSLGGACGGLAESWDNLYGDASSCCAMPAFSQVKRSDCEKA